MPLSQRQIEYLHLMGIPVYRERLEEESTALEDQEFVSPQISTGSGDSGAHNNNPVSGNEDQLSRDNTQAIQDVLSRISPEPVKSEESAPVEVSIHEVLKRSELPDDWSDLIDHVSNCQRCDLHKTRTQTVFGVGNIQADWMIIGEAPGAEEDKQGEPFLGQSGDLLNAILESVGLARSKVYIANGLKCRPPANRDPKSSELAQCRAYLEQQIALVDPKVIVCVGRIASQNLLRSEEPISRLRGKSHSIQHPVKIEKNIPVIVTYHPAYLLRSPSQKRKVWDDLKLAFSTLNDDQ